jgi:hypothetical protein
LSSLEYLNILRSIRGTVRKNNNFVNIDAFFNLNITERSKHIFISNQALEIRNMKDKEEETMHTGKGIVKVLLIQSTHVVLRECCID